MKLGTRKQVQIHDLKSYWGYRGLREGLTYWVEWMGAAWIFVSYPSCQVDWDRVTEV